MLTTPLFYDCDSLGLFWSPAAKRFVCTNKTLQPFLKHIQDHGEPTRRTTTTNCGIAEYWPFARAPTVGSGSRRNP